MAKRKKKGITKDKCACTTRIVVAAVLDESGSMYGRRNQVISGYNEYIDSLRRQKNVEYRVSLTKFNTVSTIVYANRPLSEVPPLNASGFIPNGGTALVDAVGDTISSLVVRPNEAALILVMTDGEENSS